MARRHTPKNKNATIRQRSTRNGKFRTETFGRDPRSIEASVSTNPRTNSTQVFIDIVKADEPVRLNGREARTLYRLLQKHYSAMDKTW